MKTLFFLGALAVVGLVITGAIKLQKSDSTISIQIDRQRAEQDAERVVQEGKQVLQEAESTIGSSTQNSVTK